MESQHIRSPNECECGCGYEIGSSDFQRIHVSNDELREMANVETRIHSPNCFCVRCDG